MSADRRHRPRTAPRPDLDTIVGLCKRRGFVYPSAEIYGGSRAAWDYGPLGVELKENVKRQWWLAMVRRRDDVVGLDSSVILPHQVWEASGHVEAFVDPLTECRVCHHRFQSDHLEAEYRLRQGRAAAGPEDLDCPACGSKGAFTPPRMFSGLVETRWGPTALDAADEAGDRVHYLRPETAQGAFVNFLNVLTTSRRKPPFGIAQLGKSFRNEITPGNFLFRTREFEQMECEFFVKPGEDEEWHEYWIQTRRHWYVDLGIDPDDLRLYEHPPDQRSHYAKRTVDIEYRFGIGPDGYGELEGIANRADYDLAVHSRHSGVDLSYYDQTEGRRWRPYVIEPAAGVNRSFVAFLLSAYDVDEAPNAKGRLERRTVLRLDHRLAPVKAAVLPLSRNADLSPKAKALAGELRELWNIEFDDAGAIGRRYRRQDEIGTPYCVTVDFESLEDHCVTVRERDSMKQERIAMDAVADYLRERLVGC